MIPSQAHCKITCRLVGDMDPAHVRESIRAHIEARLLTDAKITWSKMSGGSRAAVMDISRPEFSAARSALTEEWNRAAVFCGMGGSIPIAGFLKEILGVEAMLIADDAIQSSNEKYDVGGFHKGIRSWVRVLDALTKI